MFFRKNKNDSKKLQLLEEQTEYFKDIRDILESLNRAIRRPYDGVKIVFSGKSRVYKLNKGEKMADLVLNFNDTKQATLHYLKSGTDLGAVPVADGPLFTVSDTASLNLTQNSDGSITLKDLHNGDTDVDVTLTGVAKGFSVTKTITCKGVAPPPITPDAVDIIFS